MPLLPVKGDLDAVAARREESRLRWSKPAT